MRGSCKVTLVGNIGKDLKVTNFDDGVAIGSCSIATTESWRNKMTGQIETRTDWHQITFENKGNHRLLDNAKKLIKSGHKVHITGKVKNRTWIENDITFVSTEIVADTFNMLPKGPITYSHAVLIGNSGQDAVHYQRENNSFSIMSLATHKKTFDSSTQNFKDDADWFEVLVADRGNFKLSEIVRDKVKKGTAVLVDGALRTKTWEQDGVTRYKTVFYAKEVQIYEDKDLAAEQNTPQPEQNTPQPDFNFNQSSAKTENASPYGEPRSFGSWGN